MNRRQVIQQAIGLGLVSTTGVGITSPHLALIQEINTVRFGALSDAPLNVFPTSGPAANLPSLSLGTLDQILIFSSPRDTPQPSNNELSNQFLAFQAANVGGHPKLLEASEAEPVVETTDTQPDVVMDVSLQAFHLAENEMVNRDSRLTMRLTLAKDDDSPRARDFETLFWSVTAGLKLYDDIKNQRAESQTLKSDFRKALGNKFIEIPGALGTVKLEVIKHKEPAWWQRVFSFLQSDGGKALTAALGFPAVTQQVVKFVDDAASRLEGNSPEIVFASRPLKFAFSKQARAAYVGSSPIKIGCLSPGLWIMARGRDFSTLANKPAYFMATYGKLVPEGVAVADVLSGNYNDPYKNITYVVFKVLMKPHRLDFTLT